MVVVTLAMVFWSFLLVFSHWTLDHCQIGKKLNMHGLRCVDACSLRDCRIDIVAVKISGLYFVAIHQRKFLLGCIELDVE